MLEYPTTDGDFMGDEAGPMAGSDPTAELTADLTETTSALFSAGTVQDTLTRIAALAVFTIEGCDFAGIFTVGPEAATASRSGVSRGATTGGTGVTELLPVATDPLVSVLDDLQRHAGQGPSFDAVAQNLTLYADDLQLETRWTEFVPTAAKQGVRSLLAIPLMIDEVPAALTLYANYPQAFGVIDRGRGLLLAVMAGGALAAARNHEAEERREANFHAALATRELIGQAQGILMEREHLTGDQAFDVLRRASQHLNIKLRDIAQDLIETGERPDTGR